MPQTYEDHTPRSLSHPFLDPPNHSGFTAQPHDSLNLTASVHRLSSLPSNTSSDRCPSNPNLVQQLHFQPIMPVYTPIEDFVAQLPEPEDDPFFLDLVASLQPGVDQDISDNDNFFEDYLEPPAQAVWDELERGPFQGLLDQDTFSLGAYVHDEPAGNG
jgi:hypothetical protein